jgi:protein-L-isoaspartate(D-aspartate) O-methyltransferase
MWRSKPPKDEESFSRELDDMLKKQIAARGIEDERVLGAMRRVPRHLFVPRESRAFAYEDHPVQIGHGQTISQPYMVALMTEMLKIGPTDRVLEIGTGSAYQAAILAELAAEVITVERNEDLAERARNCLLELGYANVSVIVGDGTLGYPARAPYDAIVVTAAGPSVPPSLKVQLAIGGRLVCPVGSREIQTLVTLLRTEDGFDENMGIGCVFVPLVGEEGWSG